MAPDGNVVNGIWGWNGEVVSAAEGVAGLFTMSGSGPLGGNASRIELSGNIHMSGTVTVNGAEFPIENDSPAGGAFSPRSVSCNVVSGDMATEGRQIQQEAGLATTVTAPFTAQRIGAPGDQGLANFEETYTELVLTAEGLLAAGVPPVEDIVALVERAESFYHQVYLSIECPGGATSMLPGNAALLALRRPARPSAADGPCRPLGLLRRRGADAGVRGCTNRRGRRCRAGPCTVGSGMAGAIRRRRDQARRCHRRPGQGRLYVPARLRRQRWGSPSSIAPAQACAA